MTCRRLLLADIACACALGTSFAVILFVSLSQ
jgi:hypothetical protein